MKRAQVSRCWTGARPKYRNLIADPDVRRWYDNVSRGSKITADVYLRRLGSVCLSKGMKSPRELLTQAADHGGQLWAYNFVMDLVTELQLKGKAGSYIHSNAKAIRSWFAHNGIGVEGRIKIKGAQDAPSLRDKTYKRMLILAGFTEKDIVELKLLELDDDQIALKAREKLSSSVFGEEKGQRIVPLDGLEEYLAKGWKCEHVMESRGQAIISPPAPS